MSVKTASGSRPWSQARVVLFPVHYRSRTSSYSRCFPTRSLDRFCARCTLATWVPQGQDPDLICSSEEWSRTCASVGCSRSVPEDQLPNLADVTGLDTSGTDVEVDGFHDAFPVEEVAGGGWQHSRRNPSVAPVIVANDGYHRLLSSPWTCSRDTVLAAWQPALAARPRGLSPKRMPASGRRPDAVCLTPPRSPASPKRAVPRRQTENRPPEQDWTRFRGAVSPRGCRPSLKRIRSPRGRCTS